MSFVTKLFAHKDGTFLARLWETVAGGPLVAAHMSVDKWGEPADFSAPIEVVGMYRDFRLGSGQKPPTLAPGERGLPMLDKYQVQRASLAVEGVETDAFPPRDFAGTQVFSANRVPMIASYGVAFDSRNQKPTANRVVNGVHRFNTVAAGVYSALVYTGPARLVRMRLRNAAAYPVFLKIYDSATAIDEAAALPAPVMTYELEPNAVADLSFGDYVVLAGLAIRMTKSIEDDNKTALALGDIRSFNLLYAR